MERQMAKFCKGAEVVDAFRWTADENQADDPSWIVDAIKSGLVTFTGVGDQTVRLLIHSPGRTFNAAPGDWIIRGPTGEITACPHQAFQRDFREQTELAMCE
jgi:hypothetical protein